MLGTSRLARLRTATPGFTPPPGAGWSRWQGWWATARWRAPWLLAALLLPPLLAALLAFRMPPLHEAEMLLRLDLPEAASAEAALLRAQEPAAAPLRVDILAEGRVLRLRLAHADPEAAQRQLEARLAAWLAARDAFWSDAEGARLAARLAALEAEARAAAARLGALDLVREAEAAIAHRQRLAERLDDLAAERAAALGRLAAAEVALAAQPGRVLGAVERSNAPLVEEPRTLLTRLLAERARMRAQYQPDAPMLAELEARIGEARRALAQAGAQRVETQREERNPLRDALETRVLEARIARDALAGEVEETTRLRAEAEARAAALVAALEPRRAHDALAARLAARPTPSSPGIGVPGEARLRPGTTHPGAAWVALGAGAGLLAALLLGALLTRWRKVFLHPAEAERATGLPGLGALPAGAMAGTPPAIASLAVQLLDGAPPGHPQMVQFLGTRDGDGRDAAARALAVELARGHGLSVALIDLDGDGRRHLGALGDPAAPPIPSPEGVFAHATGVPRLWITYQQREAALMLPQTLETGVMHMADRLRSAFDVCVLIGSGQVDSYARRRLSVLVDGNILVVGQGHTPRRAAQALIGQVQSGGGRFFGMVWTERARAA